MLDITIRSPYDLDERMYLVESRTKPETNVRIHTFETIPKCCDWCGVDSTSKYNFEVEVTNK